MKSVALMLLKAKWRQFSLVFGVNKSKIMEKIIEEDDDEEEISGLRS